MLQGEDIICVSWIFWDSMPLVMHQMMTRFAKNNRVLFVDPPRAYSNLIVNPTLLRDQWEKTWLWLRGVRKIKESLYVYHPPPLVLQYGHSLAVDSLSQEFMAFAIKRTAKKLGFKSPILWLYHPYAIMPRGQFNEKAVCYDCNDDVGFFFCQHFNKREKLSVMEERLTKKADVVFAISKNLFHLRKGQNTNTHYLPSGVDINHFQQVLSPSLKIASELEGIPRPILGFIGSMVNAKMNWEWVLDAALSHPQWSFVFVGPCDEPPPPPIREQKNIIFVGAKPMASLPSYLKAFEVCLIPYQGEEFLKACAPTKTFEYLAAGKPVVSSWIPELEDYQHVIRLSRDAKEFVQHIEAALIDGQEPSRIQEYVRATDGWTWEDRLEKASALVSKCFSRPSTS